MNTALLIFSGAVILAIIAILIIRCAVLGHRLKESRIALAAIEERQKDLKHNLVVLRTKNSMLEPYAPPQDPIDGEVRRMAEGYKQVAKELESEGEE